MSEPATGFALATNATWGGYCAVLTSNGSVDCWGIGFNGELGNGTDNYETDSTFPVSVFAPAS